MGSVPTSSCERLAFHLLDSQSFRTFVRHPLGWIPNKSTLQRNISKLSAAGWKAINGVLAEWAAEKGLEKGQRIRLDSTAVESDIHHPTDSSLLYDAVRTVSRLLGQLKERQGELQAEGQAGGVVLFTNHRREPKTGVSDEPNVSERIGLKVARKTYGYGRAVLADLPRRRADGGAALCPRALPTLMAQVISDGATRPGGRERARRAEGGVDF